MAKLTVSAKLALAGFKRAALGRFCSLRIRLLCPVWLRSFAVQTRVLWLMCRSRRLGPCARLAVRASAESINETAFISNLMDRLAGFPNFRQEFVRISNGRAITGEFVADELQLPSEHVLQ